MTLVSAQPRETSLNLATSSLQTRPPNHRWQPRLRPAWAFDAVYRTRVPAAATPQGAQNTPKNARRVV